MGLSNGFHPLESKWCWLCAPTPAQVQGVTKLQGGFCKSCGQSLEVRLGDSHGTCEMEPRAEGKREGRHPRELALCALSHSGMELQSKPCLPCHFEGMFVKLEDKLYLIYQLAWLITSKYLNIWYLGFYLYSSSSPENVAGKPTDDVF